MPITEKAGNLLPQNEPQLAKFIQAQSHIRAAAHLIDEISTCDLPFQEGKLQDTFRHICDESYSKLWEVDSSVADLLYLYHAPLFPIDEKPQ